MSDVLEAMRAKNRAVIELPSGLKVTGQLPRIRDCIIAGDIPLPVLQHLEDAGQAEADPSSLTTEQMRAAARFNDELVKAFVIEIEDQPVTLDDSDTGLFTEDDYNAIVMYATRVEPLPGKD